ncbi:copper resistance D family protein [Oceanobacillus chungangensis]|uniref:Copper resistance protein CopD n=1 Tax=Oceanobacillus chungangensis TaxID=1229152 RepID=A0A3D8PJ77_9BACI|nr:CopD family protein [Oceanobacillus chungangensis]RDW16153.1 copper resistance protein CopD [Oceanobacillus chungangensis]
MDIIVIISQALLYLCFSILAGSFLLLLVPSSYRPNIKIPKYLLLISAIILPVFAFFPVLDSILFIAPRLGLLESFKIVLTTYTVGTAWDFTLIGSVLLVLLISLARPKEKDTFAFLGTVLTFGLILTVAWSSHAGAMEPITGIISHFIHLTAASIWVGVVLIVGWCAINHNNWLKFLSWFSKIAIGCLTATAISGILLTNVMVDGYTDSWMVSYGQGLLIKHLFLLPLVFYALLNGLIVKYKVSKDITFNPIPWVRVEGLILFVIFTITAIFSQQSPPHGNYLTNDAVSPLFRLFHDVIIDSSNTIGFTVNLNIVYFFFLCISLVGLIILSIYKKASIMITFLLSCLFVMSIYFMLMISVVIS